MLKRLLFCSFLVLVTGCAPFESSAEKFNKIVKKSTETEPAIEGNYAYINLLIDGQVPSGMALVKILNNFEQRYGKVTNFDLQQYSCPPLCDIWRRDSLRTKK